MLGWVACVASLGVPVYIATQDMIHSRPLLTYGVLEFLHVNSSIVNKDINLWEILSNFGCKVPGAC